MSKRIGMCLFVPVLIALLAAPALSAPPSLQEAWSVPGAISAQGNFDDDPALELLVFSSSSGEFEFIDAGSGVGEGALSPSFSNFNNVLTWVVDVDNDGRDELLISYQPPAAPRMTALYDWTSGTGYDEVFLHNDDYDSITWGALRSSVLDLIENGLNDFVIRDVFGAAVFTASSDIAGWSGAGFIESMQVLDADSDGLDEILVSQSLSGMRTLRLIDFPSAQVAVGDTPGPSSTRLLSYPNPSAGRTTIAFDLPERGRTVVQVYDAQGRLVRDLVDGDLPEGRHTVPWDGRNNRGLPVAAGAYFYRLDAPGIQASRRLVRIR